MNLSDPTELGRILKLQLSIPSMIISEINFSLRQISSGISYIPKHKSLKTKTYLEKVSQLLLDS